MNFSLCQLCHRYHPCKYCPSGFWLLEGGKFDFLVPFFPTRLSEPLLEQAYLQRSILSSHKHKHQNFSNGKGGHVDVAQVWNVPDDGHFLLSKMHNYSTVCWIGLVDFSSSHLVCVLDKLMMSEHNTNLGAFLFKLNHCMVWNIVHRTFVCFHLLFRQLSREIHVFHFHHLLVIGSSFESFSQRQRIIHWSRIFSVDSSIIPFFPSLFSLVCWLHKHKALLQYPLPWSSRNRASQPDSHNSHDILGFCCWMPLQSLNQTPPILMAIFQLQLVNLLHWVDEHMHMVNSNQEVDQSFVMSELLPRHSGMHGIPIAFTECFFWSLMVATGTL